MATALQAGVPLRQKAKKGKTTPVQMLKKVSPHTQVPEGAMRTSPGMKGPAIDTALGNMGGMGRNQAAAALQAAAKAKETGATTGAVPTQGNLTGEALQKKQMDMEKQAKLAGSAKGVGLTSSIQANTVGITGTQRPIGMADRYPTKTTTDTKKAKRGKMVGTAVKGSSAQAAATQFKEMKG
jgi:hypothetical protein